MMSTQRSPIHSLVSAKDLGKVDQYFTKTNLPVASSSTSSASSTQASKQQRPESAGNQPCFNESTDDMIRETLQIVRSMDTPVAGLESKITVLVESASFQNAEIENLKIENTKLKAENAALSLRMDDFDSRMDEMDANLERESAMCDALETNSRKINLELSGIPKKENETDDDCKEAVGKLLTLIGSENGKDCVDVAHRKFAGGIIIKFKSRCQRNEVFSKRFNLFGKSSRDLGFDLPEKGNALYLNESLSFDRSRLMKDIRDRLKLLNIGKSKETRIRAKTDNGVIKVQDRAGNYQKISKMIHFNALYPF